MIKRQTISLRPPCGDDEPVRFAERDLGCRPTHFKLLKKSVDARKKNDVRVVYMFEYGDSEPDPPASPGRVKRPRRVLVVGSGPAGMFCAVRLADRGFAPVVVERGGDVDGRSRDVGRFFGGGELDEQSNVQFGEGGAGTFSDGKLNSGTHGAYNEEVYRTFVRFGAPEETLYLNKPHIGSDGLRAVVKNMRSYVIACGGEVRFRTRLTDLRVRGGKAAVVLTGEKGEAEEVYDDAVLAVGHSARDTFAMLYGSGFAMESRDFAVGVRIEHLQREISAAQYGGFAKYLPPADYKAVSSAGERRVFTFCMCPGGYVVPAQSERGTVVTNGMSLYSRGGENANAALLAQVTRADFGSDDPLAGVEYQRAIERAAYELTGSYAAPVMTVGDFLKDPCGEGTVFCDTLSRFEDDRGILRPAFPCGLPEYSGVELCSQSDFASVARGTDGFRAESVRDRRADGNDRSGGGATDARRAGGKGRRSDGEMPFGGLPVMPTYALGVRSAPLGELLPSYVVRSLQAGIRDIARRIRGFDDPYALLTAPETRFSSPVRILRGDLFTAVGTDNIYPCGEGAGYSGGITSSACDGFRIADAICAKCE